MKHVSKALLLTLVLVLAVSVLAACSGVSGLTEQGEALGTPETTSRNKEPYSTTLVPYASVEQALGGDYKSSPYYQSLNGEWDFSLVINPKLIPSGVEGSKYAYQLSENPTVCKNEEENVSWGKISVPANWEMEGYDAPSYTYNTYPWGSNLAVPNVSESYNPVGIYRNYVNIPSDWNGRQVYITFEGVASCVYVYVNGAMVGYAEDSYTGKTFNLTEAIKYGEDNLVVFKVYKYCDASYLEANDSIKFGGIYRDVYLYSAPETQIRDFTYDMQMSGTDALMNVTVSIASYNKPSNDLTVAMSVYDSEGNLVLNPTTIGSAAKFSDKPVSTANAYLGEVGSRISVPSPKLWTAETPNLYTVVLELKDGEDVIDIVSKRIGFKTVGVVLDDNGRQEFLLNDQLVVLRGILYNENSPVNGMAVTREEMIRDIQKMKEMNVNAVRSPGRPLSEEFISLCDEYGLYVIDDMSLNSNPATSDDDLSVPGDQSVWQNACLDRLLNVVYRDKNSASVIMWALGSNSGTGSNFSVLRRWLTSADTRMIVYDDDVSASDLVISSNPSLSEFYTLLSDANNKKVVLLQDTRGGLLNNGGNFSSYSNLIDSYKNFQGGFFAYFADNAIYWPINVTTASEILRNTPYNEANAALYRLTYAGGWGDTTSAKDGYSSLSGVLTADRNAQTDAAELKNALSPVYIVAEDVANGIFRVSNRNGFTELKGVYSVSYEITDGKTVLSSGTVSDLDVAPGETDTFKINYGVDLKKGLYYIYFKVDTVASNANVFSKQIALTENSNVPKDGTVKTHVGADLNLSTFQAPEIYVSEYTFAKGEFYITNLSSANFNDLYTVSWTIYEQHAYWADKRWVLYDEGTLENFDVPAGSKNLKVTLPIKYNAAAMDAVYAAYLTLTTKVDVAGVPAGTAYNYVLNSTGVAKNNIPFVTDPARDPITLGYTEFGDPIMGPAEVDTEPPSDPEKDMTELPQVKNSYAGSSIILIQNDKLVFEVNADTGLISKYFFDGKEIFVPGDMAESSMISNLVRNPTGGDMQSSAVTTASLEALKNLSQNYFETKSLPEGYKITRVAANHYRIELDYLWVTYPVQYYRAFSYDTTYTVVYDIFSDGELQVSIEYAPTVKTAVPLELSSIITLPTDFKTMSWFGMGPGETYSDKTSDSRVGVYEDVSIVDQLGAEYIYSTGNGDKTEIRWVSFEREDGSGVVITSDTELFAVNVSKDYPWNTQAYPSSAPVAASKPTILRVIGQQRGVSANTFADQKYSEASYLEPGVVYTYSFRVVPVTAGYDADAISRTSLGVTNDLVNKEPIELANKTFALTNAVASSTMLSSIGDGSVSVKEALGSDSQYWIVEEAKDHDIADIFRLKNLANGEYLSPVSRDSAGVLAAKGELTVAPYKGFVWQNWLYDDGNLFCQGYSAGSYYGLYLSGSNVSMSAAGARLVIQMARSEAYSKWTMISDTTDTSKVRIQSSFSGKYLTLVDSMTYSNPLIEDLAYRLRNYSVRTNWNNIFQIKRATPYTEDSEEWTGSANYVTQWDLLPAATQMWTFVPVDGGYVIMNKSTGKALTLADGQLKEAAITNAANQVWSVLDCGGMYGIVNTATDMALTLATVNGTNVLTVEEWDDLALQKWDLASEDSLSVKIEAGANWFN